MDEPVQIVDDHTQINEPVSNELKNPRTGRGYTQGETLARFRELIQYGRQKDALEWAMRTQLWGHALMLAYKMDSTKHTHVMGRFCQAMASHDPLQTAYQFLSGRQPSAVTQIPEQDITSWRAHLSMILSNSTQNSNITKLVYQRSINSLADTLWNKGLLYASQFCYLLGNKQKSFGYYNRKSSKIVLIGGDHTLGFGNFLTLKALQMTEVYEYAMGLSSASSLASFQPLKFVYACWLLDHGLVVQAFAYFELIASEIIKEPHKYHRSLILKLSDLAFRTQLHGQNRHAFTDQAQSPQWLRDLNSVAEQVMFGRATLTHNSNNSVDHSARPVPPLLLKEQKDQRNELVFSPTTDSIITTDRSELELRVGSAMSGESSSQFNHHPTPPQAAAVAPPVDYQAAYSYEQQQHSANATAGSVGQSMQQYEDQSRRDSQKSDHGYQPYQPMQQQQQETYQQQAPPPPPPVEQYQPVEQQQQHYQPAPPVMESTRPPSTSNATQAGYYVPNQQNNQPSYQQPEEPIHQPAQAPPPLSYAPMEQQPLAQTPSEFTPQMAPTSVSAPTPSMPPPPTMPSMQAPQQPATFAQQQTMLPPAQTMATPSMPPPMAMPSMPSQASQMAPSMAPPSMAPPSMAPPSMAPQSMAPTPSNEMFQEQQQQNNQSQNNNQKESSADKENKPRQAKMGWLGKTLANVLPKSITGEVHLPDDNDKSLYYDDKLKRWVDKNATEEEQAPPPPPPEIPMMAPSANPNQMANGIGGGNATM